MSTMCDDADKDWSADLNAIEERIAGRESPQTIAPHVRDLESTIPDDSPHRPRVLRLRGIVLNRCRDPNKALAYLNQARQKAIEQGNRAEMIEAAREMAVVHAWRGEDRDAALALLRAVAAAYLHRGKDREESDAALALALGEAGRLELEAQRFAEAARLFRLLAERQPQPLDAYQLLRVRINLCQALNRLGQHEEALTLVDSLEADIAKAQANTEDGSRRGKALRRLAFLARLEAARAPAGLKHAAAAAESLARARELLPEHKNEFEHDEAKETEAELKLAREDWTAIEDLKRLAKGYTDPSLTVRAANLRTMAARTLFKTGQAPEAGRLLAEALRDAVNAGLPELAQRLRTEMLQGEGARHLATVLKEASGIESIGGEWQAWRQLIRIEMLGEGGAGKVYRAIDLREGDEVAVKEISFAATGEEKRKQIIETVRNEYAVAVTLPKSRCIAKVRGLLCDPDGTLYIVQELVKGSSLAKLYTLQPEPARLLPLLLDVTEALGVLHANHVVHRDLKPDNVMVRRSRGREEAVLVDFGIALLEGLNDSLEGYGTASYRAPEQAGSGRVGSSADIYAFGKMIAEVWVGEGRSGKIPGALAAIVDKMQAIDPKQRPSLDAIKAALEASRATVTA